MDLESAAGARALHLPLDQALRAGWSWLSLADGCEGVFDCPHSTPQLVESGPLVVRSQDIITGVFRVEQAARVSEKTYQERIARATPTRGDLLYSREGTYFGIAAEVPTDTRVCLGQRMVLIRPKAAVLDFRYLRQWLNSPIMTSHVHGLRDGSVAERLNLPTIRALPILVPPLAEQHAIANTLGAVEDKIDLNRRMSETLESMARALFKSWFIDFDPVQRKGDGPAHDLPDTVADLFPGRLVDAEGAKVPEGWPFEPLREKVRIVKGRSYTSAELVDSDTALVTLKSFLRGGGYRTDGLKAFAGSYKSEQVVTPGELLVACTDVTQAAEVIGRPAIVRASSEFKTLVASLDTLIVRPSGEGMSRSFLYFLMGSEGFRAHTYAHTTGTTVLHLAKEAVPSFRFPVPPTEVVMRFDGLAGPILDRIQSLEQESEALAAMRDALLPRLVSGSLAVGGAIS